MKDINEKIYGKYNLESDNQLNRKLHEKANWIKQNVYGNDVLNVGFSQGVIPILLAREGKTVLGIKASIAEIKATEKKMMREEKELQRYITLIKDDFFLREFDKQFETIILNEVIANVTNIHDFLKKVAKLTKDNGKVLIISSFEKGNSHNNKNSFYLWDYLKFQKYGIVLDDIKVSGEWIGVTFIKTDNYELISIEEQSINEFEKKIYTIECLYRDKLNKLYNEVQLLNEKVTVLEEELKEHRDYKNKFIQEKVEKVHIQKELLEQYSIEENIIEEKREISREYELLQDRYNNIRNSTLGRLTVKYWKWKSKRGNR